MTVPDTLRRAADVIGTQGWHTGRDVAPQGDSPGVCASGAIRVALGQRVETGNVFNQIYAPITWTNEDYTRYARDLDLATTVTNAYLHHKAPSVFKTEQHLPLALPHIVYFNDTIASGPEAVQQVLRDAAEWLESGAFAQIPTAHDDETVPVEKVPVTA